MGGAFLPLLPGPYGGSPARRPASWRSRHVRRCWPGAARCSTPSKWTPSSGSRASSVVATHYGAYNTVSGVAITLGNLVVGALFDAGVAWLPWSTLAGTGLLCAAAMAGLHRGGHLTPRPAVAATMG